MDKLKTPCFNFYPESFLGGIRKMTDKEVGIYIKALCYQFNEGAIEDDEFKTFPKRVQGKFIKTEQGWINERLEFERARKKKYTDSRMKNFEGRSLDDRLRDAGIIK